MICSAALKPSAPLKCVLLPNNVPNSFCNFTAAHIKHCFCVAVALLNSDAKFFGDFLGRLRKNKTANLGKIGGKNFERLMRESSVVCLFTVSE